MCEESRQKISHSRMMSMPKHIKAADQSGLRRLSPPCMTGLFIYAVGVSALAALGSTAAGFGLPGLGKRRLLCSIPARLSSEETVSDGIAPTFNQWPNGKGGGCRYTIKGLIEAANVLPQPTPNEGPAIAGRAWQDDLFVTNGTLPTLFFSPRRWRLPWREGE